MNFVKFLFLLVGLNVLPVFAEERDFEIPVATVDSGFGGFFTAKALENEASNLYKTYQTTFSINHYGDTLNAPYGEKTPDQIAGHAAKLVTKAHDAGAKYVFLACNTASSQFDKIMEILAADPKTVAFQKNTFSIIDSSVATLKDKIESLMKRSSSDIHLALLVTPATLKSDIYPRNLQKAFGLKEIKNSHNQIIEQTRWRQVKTKTIQSAYSVVDFSLNDTSKQRVYIHQIAPGNWVEMIEYQASPQVSLESIVKDLKLLTSTMPTKKPFQLVAEFCTHFPVYHQQIKNELEYLKLSTNETDYLQQGEIFAKIFRDIVVKEHQSHKRKKVISKSISFDPAIFITGDNKLETEKLVNLIFPEQKNVSVSIIK